MGNLEQRLKALEGKVRRSRHINLALAFAFVAIICFAGAQAATQQAAPPQKGSSPGSLHPNEKAAAGKDRLRTIEADRFVLLDHSGRTRTTMEVTGQGPAITMFDEKGHKRLVLSQERNTSGLSLYDSEGIPLVSLQLPRRKEQAHLEIKSNQGSTVTKAGGFSVRDSSESNRLHLALINGNFPVLGISQSGQNGPPSIEMTASDDGSRRIKLHNNEGSPLFSVFAAESGNTYLNLRHPEHERSLQISTGTNQEDGPKMSFFAPTKKDGSGGLLPFLQLGLRMDNQPYIRSNDNQGKAVFTAPAR